MSDRLQTQQPFHASLTVQPIAAVAASSGIWTEARLLGTTGLFVDIGNQTTSTSTSFYFQSSVLDHESGSTRFLLYVGSGIVYAGTCEWNREVSNGT